MDDLLEDVDGQVEQPQRALGSLLFALGWHGRRRRVVCEGIAGGRWPCRRDPHGLGVGIGLRGHGVRMRVRVVERGRVGSRGVCGRERGEGHGGEGGMGQGCSKPYKRRERAWAQQAKAATRHSGRAALTVAT